MTRPRHRLDPDTIARLTADTSPYLSCDDCFAQLDQYVERRLADPQHLDPALDAHLLGCGACAEEAEGLRTLLLADAG